MAAGNTTFNPQSPNAPAPAIDVQILAELRIHTILLQQLANMPDDRLDTLRLDVYQTISIA